MSLDCNAFAESLQRGEPWREHAAGCSQCAALLAVERRLRELVLEPMPRVDISAAVMARTAPQADPLPALAWAPLLLLVCLALPEPAGVPAWPGLVWNAWLQCLAWVGALSLPAWTLPALAPLPVLSSAALDATALGVGLTLLITTWRWRQYAKP